MRFTNTIVAAAMISIAAPVAAQYTTGTWNGQLNAGGTILRIVVHVDEGSDGTLTGTMDSPDQGAAGIPITQITAEGGALAFAVPLIGGRYEATWDAEEDAWKGMWSQGGAELPLDLTAGELAPPEPLPADWQLPSDTELEALIEARTAPRDGQGIVIGVLGPDNRRVIGNGPAGGEQFDENTLFEIGSISKVFTAMILADMAAKGEVSLDDPVQRYLPEGVTMPVRGGKEITLADLAAHHSGLPRLPDNMPLADPDDPYADYTEAMLLEFVTGHELQNDIGGKWDYSNLGVGLLGYVLTQASGKDYEILLRERITDPLRMDDTAVSLTPALQERFSPGYDAFMRPAKPWHLSTLVGAGGIRSTVDDMLAFAAAALDPQSPIAPAMELMTSVRRTGPTPDTEQVLGWQLSHPEAGRDILMHNGGTGGYRSALALEPAKKRAVVALTNTAAEPATTDLALHALIGSPVAATPPILPAPPAQVERNAVDLPVEELERVVGRYEFAPGVVFEVTREGDRLRAHRRGSAVGPVLQIFPEAPLKFFWRAVDGQIEFTTDASGTVTGAEATFDGQKLTGRKLEP